MEFNSKQNTRIDRDSEGRVRSIEHNDQPFTIEATGLVEPSAQELAREYIKAVFPTYNLNESMLEQIHTSFSAMHVDENEGALLRLEKEKNVAGSEVLTYGQTYNGMPVWGSQLSVHMYTEPLEVTSSTSSVEENIEIDNPNWQSAEFMNIELTADDLAPVLDVEYQEDEPSIEINGTRNLIYRYEAEERVDLHEEEEDEGTMFDEPPLTLPLRDIPVSIQSGNFYVVREVLFTYALQGWGEINWRVFVEPEKRAVLYLRPLVASMIVGMVWKTDPVTRDGATAPGGVPYSAASPAGDLDRLRESVVLENITPVTGNSERQGLSGRHVELRDLSNPNIAPPTTGEPIAFNYSAKTDYFSAVNAYYHVDHFFNLVEKMGFKISGPDGYFSGTTFPVPVDHRGMRNKVNAQAPGNVSGSGLGSLKFGLVTSGHPVGIANAVRVVLHELGHGILWNHVSSPGFGFAHSPGDSLAAILMDPESQAPDRFATFPFMVASGGIPAGARRHDRAVSDGWAWYGRRWNPGYGGEQVLSTTLFRIYLAIGGDSKKLTVRKLAADVMFFLIIKSCGLLSNTTHDPEVYVTALINADRSPRPAAAPGYIGTTHKIIRWAFEKQGLFQSSSRINRRRPSRPNPPIDAEGLPPEVDVYIEDGRQGEYNYLEHPSDTQDIWNRITSGNGPLDQSPSLGNTNLLYVRVKNRGTEEANNVNVKIYMSQPGIEATWPTDWEFVSEESDSEALHPGGETVIGPIRWTPQHHGHGILAIASADGDLGNDTTVKGETPLDWLLLDNNIAYKKFTNNSN